MPATSAGMTPDCCLRSKTSRIDQTSMRARPRGARPIGRLDMAWAKNVEHRLAGGDQVIRDDAPVAPPPHGFCAHHGAAPLLSEVPQCRQPAPKAFAHCVVGVIVEALVLPEGVDISRRIARASAQASQRCNVLVSDFVCGERFRQNIPVILWIGARARHSANVSHERHAGASQQIDEIPDWTGRMAYGYARLPQPVAPFSRPPRPDSDALPL